MPSTRARTWWRAPYRTQERRGGADWCLDTAEGRRIAPGPPERRTLVCFGSRAELHPAVVAVTTGRPALRSGCPKGRARVGPRPPPGSYPQATRPTGLETSTNLHCCPVCVNTKEQSGRQCSGGLGGLPRGDRPARQSSTDAVQRIAESDRGLLGVSARCGRCDHRSRGFKRNSLSAALSRISVSGTSS